MTSHLNAGDLSECQRGKCDHERKVESVTLVFDACTELWKSYRSRDNDPESLPERLDLRDSLGGPVLPMLFWVMSKLDARIEDAQLH